MNALSFRFDPEAPAESRLEVVPHHSPTPLQAPTRVHASATAVTGVGVIVAGCELPTFEQSPKPISSLEVFLEDAQALGELAVRMRVSRSRHQAYVATNSATGKRSLILLGGVGEAGEEFTDVEEIPLPAARP